MPVKETINFGEVYIDGVCVGTAIDMHIESLEPNRETLEEYIREKIVITPMHGKCHFSVRITKIQAMKLLGIWSWAERNCPNKRLVYLMNHGKNNRIRYKNLRRAVQEISKHIKE